MRIGMMADIYKPYVSGVTNHIALTKMALEQHGHEVFVFTFGDEVEEDDETNVIRSPGFPLALPVADMDIRVSLRYSRRAQQLLRTMDVVHVHHPSLSGRLALRYCKPRNIPIIYTNHTRYDLYAQAYLPWMPDVLGEAFVKAFLPPFCRAVDMVIAPSEGLRSVLLQAGVDVPIHVVPNGVDLAPIEACLESVPRVGFGFREDDVVLLYVGRLGPEKNLPFLIRSFAGAARAYDNLRLLLVGDGPEMDNLIDRVNLTGIAERIRFAGLVPYEDIPCYLKMANIFVTASVTEVHPLTLIEAMAAGLPILGIESPGVGDIIQDGKTGYLAEEDIASFTAKMVRIATNSDEWKAMSLEAKTEAQKYAIEATTAELLRQYQMVIHGAKTRPRSLQSQILRALDRVR
ncbi:MAG: glycosyltransferase [Chloroflexi bacterium]|nr:glycosyltransferase [Chloroflexota bacterium]